MTVRRRTLAWPPREDADLSRSVVDDPQSWRRDFEFRLQSRLRSVYSSGRWLTVAEISQAASRLVSITDRDPDDYVLALAGRHGIGSLDDSIRVFSLDVPEGGNMLEGIRSAHRALIRAIFVSVSPLLTL